MLSALLYAPLALNDFILPNGDLVQDGMPFGFLTSLRVELTRRDEVGIF